MIAWPFVLLALVAGINIGFVAAAWWLGQIREERGRYTPGVDGIDNVVYLSSLKQDSA